jgi:predicted DNA-binding transcriptional regulator AlpA
MTHSTCASHRERLVDESARSPERCMRTPEAARYVALSESTLTKMRLTGDGPPFVKLSRAVAYRKTDLDAWLAARVHRSTSDKPMTD